jgi:hypothetical protein
VGLPVDALARLEAALQRALASGDASGLEIVGWGEISCVLAWEAGGARRACKRLPTFPGPAAAAAYAALFAEYLGTLGARDVTPVTSVLQSLAREDGVVVWCVQPMLPAGADLPSLFRRCDAERATAVFARVLDRILGCVDARVGLDGQLSNWALVGDALVYIDVTTPMLREASGADRLDKERFMASLPRALRGPVRPLVRRILDKYYDPRGVVLDLLGNLHKERLAALLPALLARANARVSPPFTPAEIRDYYAADARGWAFLQAVRRLERFWTRRVRRRPYPFLLPGRIAR